MDPFGAGAALHCIAPPGHFSSANKVGKDGARVGINVTAHQEKKKNEETKTGKKRKRENRGLILKKLCAARLRLLRGQRSEKMKGSARGICDFSECQQPFRLNPNGFGDRTTTLRWLLIGAEQLLLAPFL